MWKVMIADDEPYIREGLEKLVDWQSIGCELTCSASNGEELLQAILKDPPDLVVVDIRMPVMDGLQLAEYLYRNNLEVDVILLTAYSEFDYAQKALRLGVSDYIIKTSALDDIPEAIHRLQLRRENRCSGSWRLLRLSPVTAPAALHSFYEHCFGKLRYQSLPAEEGEEVILVSENGSSGPETLLTCCKKLQAFSRSFLGVQMEIVCSWPFRHRRDCEEVAARLRRCQPADGQVLMLDSENELLDGQDGSSLMLRIETYIQEHYTERLSLHDIAQAVHLSPGYLSRFYKAQSGENLSDAINILRIRRARELLRQGGFRIYEVANLTGFEDTAYFSKVFKKYTGCPPKEYERSCER